MPSRRRRIGFILLLYSLAVTFLLLLVSFVFIRTAAPPAASMPDVFFAATGQQLLQSYQAGAVSIRIGGAAITSSAMQDYYMKELFRYFPVILVAMFAVIFAGTWVLWKVLKRQDERQALAVAKGLRILDGGRPTLQHPAIRRSYEELKGRLEAYVGDYIRLNSYITHEQKNILSLLRAKLQLAGNAELVTEVDRVAAGIDDVLTISASGGMEHEEIVDAALACADACDDYRKIHPDIKFTFDEDGNFRIRARELWISRAVRNLIDNAIKYGEGSAIDVSVRNNKGSVVISVEDRGCGIDCEAQERLFDDRFRIGRLKKDGYGIGLNLVRHVCELCGGFVWVESAVGRGSTFYLAFPEVLTQD